MRFELFVLGVLDVVDEVGEWYVSMDGEDLFIS